ncbi:anti-sigma factor [Sagittula sp. S175]|uniref:anti-sigma factor n=1 Tax=Sagittula sp. S175 TaxID=3415129 RepID=UPI003C7A24E8
MTEVRDNGLPGGIETDAAEYALGVMPVPERAVFEARMEADEALARDVDAWVESFATLTEGYAAVTPPPNLLRRIEARIYGGEARPVWRQVLPYLLGALAAAGFAWGAMTLGLLVDVAPEVIRADLPGLSGGAGGRVTIDPDARSMVVEMTTPAPEGRVWQVWLMPVGAAPLSLGVMGPDGAVAVGLSEPLVQRMTGATVAVSDEPEGGSVTGQPSGALHAAGVPLPM